MIPFKDRRDAGKQLSKALPSYSNIFSIVLGLPRGGVVLAAEIAKELSIPLDIICPRKIGAPGNQEFAIGAITETGEGYFNQEIIEALGISPLYLKKEIEKEKEEAKRRLKVFRGPRPVLNLKGKQIVLVDDGLATGMTMKAAIATVRKLSPSKVIVAVPVAPIDTAREIQSLVDEFICLLITDNFYAVGQFYEKFPQTTDQEVIDLLADQGEN